MADHLAHFETKGGPNTVEGRDILRPKEGVQKTNAYNMVKGFVDFRGNLRVGGSEDVPEAETKNGTTRTIGVNKAFLGSP